MEEDMKAPADVLFAKGSEVLMTNPNSDFETLCGYAHNEGYHPVRLDQWLNRNTDGAPQLSAPPSPTRNGAEVLFVDGGGDVFMPYPWLAFEFVKRMANRKGYRSLQLSEWLRRNQRGPSPRSPIRKCSPLRRSPSHLAARSPSPSPPPSPQPSPSPPPSPQPSPSLPPPPPTPLSPPPSRSTCETQVDRRGGCSRMEAHVAGGMRKASLKASRKVLFTHLPRRLFRVDKMVCMLERHGVAPLSVSMVGTRKEVLRAEVKCQTPEDAERVIEKLGAELREHRVRVFRLEEGDHVF